MSKPSNQSESGDSRPAASEAPSTSAPSAAAPSSSRSGPSPKGSPKPKETQPKESPPKESSPQGGVRLLKKTLRGLLTHKLSQGDNLPSEIIPRLFVASSGFIEKMLADARGVELLSESSEKYSADEVDQSREDAQNHPPSHILCCASPVGDIFLRKAEQYRSRENGGDEKDRRPSITSESGNEVSSSNESRKVSWRPVRYRFQLTTELPTTDSALHSIAEAQPSEAKTAANVTQSAPQSAPQSSAQSSPQSSGSAQSAPQSSESPQSSDPRSERIRRRQLEVMVLGRGQDGMKDNGDFREIEAGLSETVLKFIDEGMRAQGCVIACLQGRSRSCSIATGYLIKRGGFNFFEATDLIREKRPRASPNMGFTLYLRKLEPGASKDSTQSGGSGKSGGKSQGNQSGGKT